MSRRPGAAAGIAIGRWIRNIVVVAGLGVIATSVSGCKSGCMKKPERAVHVPLDLPEAITASDVIVNMMKAFSHGDVGIAAGMCSSNVEWKENGGHLPPEVGREDVRLILESFKRAMSDARMAPRLLLVAGDSVAVQYAVWGTNDGWLAGVKGESRPVGAEGLAFMRVVDLAVTEVNNFFNPSTVLAQAGIIKAPFEPVPIPPDRPEIVKSGPVPPHDWSDRIEAAYGALGSGDGDPLNAALALDVVYRDHVAGTVSEGLKDAGASFAGYAGACADVQFKELVVIQYEQYVIAHYVWSGRYKGGIGRQWALGKTVTARRADMFRIEDDRVVEIQSFGRPDELFFQMDFERH